MILRKFLLFGPSLNLSWKKQWSSVGESVVWWRPAWKQQLFWGRIVKPSKCSTIKKQLLLRGKKPLFATTKTKHFGWTVGSNCYRENQVLSIGFKIREDAGGVKSCLKKPWSSIGKLGLIGKWKWENISGKKESNPEFISQRLFRLKFKSNWSGFSLSSKSDQVIASGETSDLEYARCSKSQN